MRDVPAGCDDARYGCRAADVMFARGEALGGLAWLHGGGPGSRMHSCRVAVYARAMSGMWPGMVA